MTTYIYIKIVLLLAYITVYALDRNLFKIYKHRLTTADVTNESANPSQIHAAIVLC